MIEHERITRQELYIQMALLMSKRSTCSRLQVGAVLTQNNRIRSTGYNGSPPNQEHCSPHVCNSDLPCTRSIHAEHNAIRNSDIPLKQWGYGEWVLYITHSPCENCARLILDKEIGTVYYLHKYRSDKGINYLKHYGVNVIQINEKGEEIR